MNKQEYLTTEHWQKQRRGALARAAYRCQVCNADNTQLEVHHRTYARLGREEPSDLFVLCESCYDLFSHNGKRAENNPEEDETEEYEEDETDIALLEEEPEAMGRFQVVACHAMSHPRLTLGGSSLLLSFVVDVAIHFDPLVVILGLGGTVAIGWLGDDLMQGAMKLLVPGSDLEQSTSDADRFAEGWLADYPVYADQSVKGKLKRLFRIEGGEVVDALPQKEGIPQNREKRSRVEEGLTYDRIVTWFDEGRIDDEQFFALLDRMDHPSRAVTRNARNDGAKPARDADGSGQNKAVTLPPGWAEEDLFVLPRLYRIENNIDKCLTGIGVSTSQDNRRFAREILKQQGLLKEK